MKIAIISMIREPWGGSEELWAAMADHGLSQGHSIIHSLFDFPTIAPKEKELMEKGLLHCPRRGYIPPGTPVPARIIRKTCNYLLNQFSNPFLAVFKQKPDYILYNGTAYSIAQEKWLLPLLHRSKIPFGIIAHYNQENGEDLRGIDIPVLKKAFDSASTIFFVSKRTLSTASRLLNKKIDRSIIIRNPVNMSSTAMVAYPKQATIQFAMAGNLRVVHKGQDIVLAILNSRTWKERDWQLNIYGAGEDEMLLKKLVKDNDLEKMVIFHGKVADIRKLWEENHILLMPSRMEGMPLAVVEAMLCGRPSVVTDVGGHTEWIDNEKEGWIAAGTDAASFEQAMEKAWQQKENWEELGKMAHAKAMRLYDPNPGKTLLDHILKSIQH